MRFNYASSSVETSPSPNQRPSPPPLGTKSRRRVYAAAAIVTVAAVALAFTLVLLTPPSASAAIPLSYDYAPGEQMSYNITSAVTNATGQVASSSATLDIYVVSFDGENYTLNETTTMYGPLSYPVSTPVVFTITEKMNKTGFVTYPLNGTGGIQSTSMFGNIGSFFEKDQAKVGETWQIPLNWGNSDNSLKGTLIYKFGNIQSVTVPAGAYQVFKMDLSGNLTSIASTSTLSLSQNITTSGQVYLEYGTCRLVESDIQESISMLLNGQASTETVSMNMTLVRHIKPY
jgi:hypothetical protein